ncbi:MAG: sugar ABC transporter permease, partial [Clostridiales bacterium]|nr:sugar ABC transporter permease [Clostridiales bacterium]
HITIPSILPTIAILLTMSVGALIAGGNLEKVLLLQNDLNYSASEMLNTYTYKLGLVNGKYSYATAIGFAMSVVSLALVLLANALSKRLSDNIGVF